MTNVAVRTGGLADLESVIGLKAEVQGLHYENRPDQFKPVDLAAIRRWGEEILQSATVRVLVAEIGATVVGYATVVRCERPEGVARPALLWWDIDEIAVRADQRRTGVGRALVQAVLAAAKAENVADVELSSWMFNRDAHAAFQSLGFVPKVMRFELRVP